MVFHLLTKPHAQGGVKAHHGRPVAFFLLQGYAGAEQLGEALKGADVIIIPAGVPRKPGMTRDDLFKVSLRLHSDICAFCISI